MANKPFRLDLTLHPRFAPRPEIDQKEKGQTPLVPALSSRKNADYFTSLMFSPQSSTIFLYQNSG